MTRLSTEIIGFDDAGAGDDHPAKNITMGHIRRWFDRVERYETALRIIADISPAALERCDDPTWPIQEAEFTTCCNLAVLRDDTKCPRCQAPVLRYGRPRSNNCLMCGKPRSVCHC